MRSRSTSPTSMRRCRKSDTPPPIRASLSSPARAPCRLRRAPPPRATCARGPLRRIEGHMIRGAIRFVLLAAASLAAALGMPAVAAPDPAFTAFLQSVWPDAQKFGIARATFDNAVRGLEPDLGLPDLVIPGRVQKQPGQPEFVQTPADYLKESSFTRLTERGRKLREQYRDVFARIEKEFGVPGPVVLAIWGRESDYSTHYGGRHAGLYGAAQGLLPRPAPLGAEDAAGRHTARRDALVLGRRHGADPVPAVGVLQVWRRFRRRPQGRHLEFGARRAGLGRQAAGRRGLGARQAVGLRGAGAGGGGLHDRRSRPQDAAVGMDQARFRTLVWPQGAGARSRRAGRAAAAGRHAWTGLPDLPQLLRHQGIQFLRSLRAVRRSSRRPHRGPAAVRDAVEAGGAAAHRAARGDAETPDRARPLQRQARRQGRDEDAARARRLSEVGKAPARLLADRRDAGAYARQEIIAPSA